MTPEQIRLEALKVIVEHSKGLTINGIPLSPDQLVQRATVLERYITR